MVSAFGPTKSPWKKEGCQALPIIRVITPKNDGCGFPGLWDIFSNFQEFSKLDLYFYNLTLTRHVVVLLCPCSNVLSIPKDKTHAYHADDLYG